MKSFSTSKDNKFLNRALILPSPLPPPVMLHNLFWDFPTRRKVRRSGNICKYSPQRQQATVSKPIAVELAFLEFGCPKKNLKKAQKFPQSIEEMKISYFQAL